MAALRGCDADTDPRLLRFAFQLLESIWQASGEPESVTRAVLELEPRFGGVAEFRVLQALVAHHTGQPGAARAALGQALALDPLHARARSLADAWRC